MVTRNVLGADLHEGDLPAESMPDGSTVLHLIHHFKTYPGRWVGHDEADHARRAFESADERGWCCTVGDHQHFHIEID